MSKSRRRIRRVRPPTPSNGLDGEAKCDYLDNLAERQEYLAALEQITGGAGNGGSSGYGQQQSAAYVLPQQGSTTYSAAVNVVGRGVDPRDILALIERQQDLTSEAQRYGSAAAADTAGLVRSLREEYSRQQQTFASDSGDVQLLGELRSVIRELRALRESRQPETQVKVQQQRNSRVPDSPPPDSATAGLTDAEVKLISTY